MLMFLLFLTGLFAGTVDAIAGGGGLISIPVLLSIGMPPHLALGTNKLQSTIGTFAATRKFYTSGLFSFTAAYPGLIAGVIGAILGSYTIQILSTAIIAKIVPMLLFIILIYMLVTPRLSHQDQKPRCESFWVYVIFGFLLGFYDGFFGPATGSFWVFALTFFLGYNLVKATAYTKLFNLNSNIISAICFAIGSNIDYKVGLCMAGGQIIGGRLGAYLAIKNGAKLIYPLFLAVVSVTIGTLAYKNYVSTQFVFTWLFAFILAAVIITAIIMLFIINKRKKAAIL